MSQLKYTHANPTDPWDRKLFSINLESTRKWHLPDHHYPGPEDSKCHGSSTSTWQYLASTKEKIQVTINPATGPEKSYWCYQAVKPSTPASTPHVISTPDLYPRLRNQYLERDLASAFQSTHSKQDIQNNMLPEEIATLYRKQIIDTYKNNHTGFYSTMILVTLRWRIRLGKCFFLSLCRAYNFKCHKFWNSHSQFQRIDHIILPYGHYQCQTNIRNLFSLIKYSIIT